MPEPLLDIRDLRVGFDVRAGHLPAVRGVDLAIAPGETVALVGESGSGKSALARALLRLNDPPFTPPRTRISGQAWLRVPGAVPRDLVTASPEALRAARARDVAMVFQDALSGLNPVQRNGAQLAEAARARHPGLGRRAAWEAALVMLAEVGLPDPEAQARKYPHQLSGGQRQRVMIGLAAIREPALLIADEPTTALDATVQARILALLADLRAKRGMAMLFISHDLDVVARIAGRVAVMYAGQIVELAETAALFRAPRHPYTQALMHARPGRRDRAHRLAGSPPDPMHLPPGCAFAPRCPQVRPACQHPPALHNGLRCPQVAP